MEKVVRVYTSFEEQEKAEIDRRSAMSIQERLNEFAIIQQRAWGKAWTDDPIRKKVSFEFLDWDIQS